MKTSSDRISRSLMLLGIFAPLMMLTIILTLSRITPDYDPISTSISQMGASSRPYANWLNGGYAIYGILMGLAAVGLYRSIDSRATATKAAIILGVHALATPLIGVFPDTLDSPVKGLGADFLHNTMSALAYVPVMIGILIFRNAARRERAFRIAGAAGLCIVTLSLPMPFFGILGPVKPVAGLLQRLLTGSSSLWVASMFFMLHSRSLRLATRRCDELGDAPQTGRAFSI